MIPYLLPLLVLELELVDLDLLALQLFGKLCGLWRHGRGIPVHYLVPLELLAELIHLLPQLGFTSRQLSDISAFAVQSSKRFL